MTFAEYMENALYGEHGYYANGAARSGREGDYFTAAETGPAFGRLLLHQLADWQERAALRPAEIIEVGAGQGKLATAMGAAMTADFPDAAERFIFTGIERGESRRLDLGRALSTMPCPAKVRPDISELGNDLFTGFVIANELIDAFPVHRVRWMKGKLEEAYVTAEPGTAKLTWGLPSTSKLERYFQRLGITRADGYETEVNLAMSTWLTTLGRVMASGLVVLFDYGRPAWQLFDEERRSGTVRGFSNHQLVDDLLNASGPIDLTADVDFTSLALDARDAGFTPVAFMEMGSFLLQAAGAAQAHGVDLSKVGSGLRYLIHPEGLGTAFHVLILAKGDPFTHWTFEYNRIKRLELEGDTHAGSGQ